MARGPRVDDARNCDCNVRTSPPSERSTTGASSGATQRARGQPLLLEGALDGLDKSDKDAAKKTQKQREEEKEERGEEKEKEKDEGVESGGDFTGEHLHMADPDLHSTVSKLFQHYSHLLLYHLALGCNSQSWTVARAAFNSKVIPCIATR